MTKEKVIEGYKTATVAETVRPAIVNELGQEVSTHDILVEIRNDIKELKRKLVE